MFEEFAFGRVFGDGASDIFFGGFVADSFEDNSEEEFGISAEVFIAEGEDIVL